VYSFEIKIQQPDDNDPQPAYQPAPVQDHHNENAPPPHILLAPQVVQQVPQIENGEALFIPTKSDIDVFVSQTMSQKTLRPLFNICDRFYLRVLAAFN
jgi:hypothetical protein